MKMEEQIQVGDIYHWVADSFGRIQIRQNIAQMEN